MSIGKILTRGQLGILGEEAEAVAEYACVLEFGRELISEHVAFLLNDLEFFGTEERLMTIGLTVNHHFET